MNTARNLLGIVGGVAAGYAIASLFLLTPLDFGVGVAVSAACVIACGLLRHVQRGRDKAYHPASLARVYEMRQR